MRLILVLLAGALLASSGVPADASTDRRATPTVTVTVSPRYPQVGSTARLAIRVGGTHGPATGWVRVRFDGAVLAACRHLVLRAGAATCPAPRSGRAKRTFAVGYRGSSTYRPKVVVRYAWA